MIKALEIHIIDTLDNDMPLVLEKAQADAPVLRYNGADDKYQNIMTSELVFNFQINGGSEGDFLHLFEGSDTRYRVNLVNVTDSENTSIIWSGCLLAEQFSEPYDNGAVFFNLIAVDGIGILKERSFYSQGKKSVIEVLVFILSFTGVNLDLWFAPAIQNSLFELDYDDLLVQTEAYFADEDDIDMYTVLEYIITSIGCKLFQQNGKWFLVGINRFNEPEIEFTKYKKDTTGFGNLLIVNIGKEVYKRPVVSKRFVASPSVEILPALRKSSVIWSAENSKFLLPENYLNEFPDGYELGDFVANEESVKNFKLVAQDSRVSMLLDVLVADSNFNYSGVDFLSYVKDLFPIDANIDTLVSGPFIELQSPVDENVAAILQNSFLQAADWQNNYITLKENIFVYESKGVERDVSIKLEFSVPMVNGGNTSVVQQVQTIITDGGFKSLFNFSVYKKEHKNSLTEVKVFSVQDNELPTDFFDIKFSIDDKALKGVLEIKSVLFSTEGFYNFRLYPMLQQSLLTAIIKYKKFEVTVNVDKNQEKEILVDIDFTTKNEIDVFHSSSRMALSDRRFSFSDKIQNDFAAGNLVSPGDRISTRYYRYDENRSGGSVLYEKVTIGLFDADYVRLKGGYSLYKKVNGVGELVEVDKKQFVLAIGQGGFELVQTNFTDLNNVNLLRQTDDLFVVYRSGNVVVDYVSFYLDKWKRVGFLETTEESFHEVLAKMYIEMLHRSFYKVSGEVLGLVFPLDVFVFNYGGQKKFYPVNIEQRLYVGKTNLTIVEQRSEDDVNVIVNTGDTGVNSNPPQIIINVTELTPNPPYSFVWGIGVNYEIKNINPVNAVLKAVHLTDSVANGGVASGFELVQSITSPNGSASFVLPYNMLDNQKGWYEVFLEQSGIVSNKEYLNINPIVERREIKITKIGLENEGRFTIEFIGFTPVGDLRLKMNKFTLGYPLGVDYYKVIEKNEAEYLVDFFGQSNKGLWSCSVVVDGVLSNGVSWFFI